MRDDGVLYICDLVNDAENGLMPHQVLEKKKKYWFENRTIGYNRFYTAQGANQRVDRLVRIAKDNTIEIGQYAILGNGEQYRITLVSQGQDSWERHKMVDSKYYRQPKIVGLEYTELTLTRLEKNYAISVNENS